MSGADLQHSAEELQLQRDPQPPGGAGHHVPPVYPGAVRNPPTDGGYAGVLPAVWPDHKARGRAVGQVIPRRNPSAETPGEFLV